MKNATLLFFLLPAAATYSKPKPHSEIVVLSEKNQTLYFRVNKVFVGGKVEVYDERNKFLESDTLPHTHTMIYFDEMPAGHYSVKVKKGEKSASLEYENKM